MIVRLRDPITYGTQYRHTEWADHRLRIEQTIAVATSLEPTSAADLSAGDGAILDSLDCPRVYGDVVKTDGWLHGPVDDTIRQLEPVDLFISTENLEHLDNPLRHLCDVRAKAARLLLSTPLHPVGEDLNPEHVWQWTAFDVDRLLAATGWDIVSFEEFDYRPMGGYLTAVWVCT